MFRILFSSRGERAFGVLPREVQQKIIDELARLAEDPLWFHRVKKLRGSKEKYRLRIG